jgi:beta-galactosidase
MTLAPLTTYWTVRDVHGNESSVTLPHDAMLGEPRSAAAPSGPHGSYFPGGRYLYTREWVAPANAADRNFAVVFEGVYGASVVRFDGETVGENVSGYREFAVPLPRVTGGSTHRIEVDVDNSALPNARWYTGSGIYRPVWLEDVGSARIARDGVSVTTTSIDGPAVVDVVVEVEGVADAAAQVTVTLEDADGAQFTATATPSDSVAHLTVTIAAPRPWSDSSPHLYKTTVALAVDGTVVDTRELNAGLRTIEVDARDGLRINGRGVLLRGACVHHDSGLLGAATLRASEFRRARLLKAAGFNAVRSSHNPLSRDFLDACDVHGLFVLDELTDVWFAPKSAHDLAARFDELWADDARSMVEKDRNHPSVIMYSIGNEIGETGSERGIDTARAIAGYVRNLDPTRPTTLALNFMLNVMAAFGKSPIDVSEHDAEKVEKKPSAASSTMANILANRIGGMVQVISKLPKADTASRDALAAVDVAGYNYAWGRYRADARRYPDRVVLGTESMPGDIAKIWDLAERLPNVIGDFTWTGWDYLGEAGIGTWSYGNEPASLAKKYPEITAGCGLIDITGHPGAALLLSKAAWGLLTSPQIAVRPLDRAGVKVRRVAWRSTDAVQSWAWAGAEGRIADIEVYSTDDEVELILNGRSLGRKRAGKSRGFVTRFREPYAPGELVAVGYRGGVETARSSLKSANAPRLRLVAEPRDGLDAAFVRIELADDNGVVEMLADDDVTVEVTGAAVLAAYGTGASATEQSYLGRSHRTHYGRALAVLRFDRGHEHEHAEVTAASRRHGSATVRVPPFAVGQVLR